jgi:hypothetical protein
MYISTLLLQLKDGVAPRNKLNAVHHVYLITVYIVQYEYLITLLHSMCVL